ncbi:hypothetical protein M9H77_07411 [Catharanthus roseus]|uniref:Uncharacterized protein n=1 Tax=Catharanthus roseus TaxID=4058 RepID=A0ACC0BUY2_CATRO|nr:hypothetical protein M9H77_07411 [Catharanthus roseus]
MFKKITPAELQSRIGKGLYFKYGDKYSHDHICANKQLNYIVLVEELDDVSEEYLMEGEIENCEEVHSMVEVSDEFDESTNVMAGQCHSGTIRIRGKVKNQEVSVLIDAGSSSGFIDQKLAAV